MGQIILIIGASKSIGLAMARTLQAQGHTVYGTSRKPEKSNVSDIRLLPLNVKDDASIQSAVDTIMAEAGRIDVVVNNAGYDLHGSAEDTTFDELYSQIDTNFFGAVRVMDAVLPIMKKQNSGKVINVSSIGGLMSLPFNSAYAASKFAIEGYSESLRYEMIPFNVYVSLIEPGQIRTETLDTSNLTTKQITTYDAKAVVAHAQNEGSKASLLPSHVADKVAQIVNTSRPKLRYKVGSQVRMVVAMQRLMPERFFENFIIGQFVKPYL